MKWFFAVESHCISYYLHGPLLLVKQQEVQNISNYLRVKFKIRHFLKWNVILEGGQLLLNYCPTWRTSMLFKKKKRRYQHQDVSWTGCLCNQGWVEAGIWVDLHLCNWANHGSGTALQHLHDGKSEAFLGLYCWLTKPPTVVEVFHRPLETPLKSLFVTLK